MPTDTTRAAQSRQTLIPGLYLDFLPRALRDRAREFYVYSTNFLPLLSGATATQSISMQGSSHFLLTAINGTVRTDAAPPVLQASPAVLIQLQDTGSGRRMADQPLDWMNMVGRGIQPGLLPWPWLIVPGGQVAVQATNLDGADRQIRVSLLGIQIYSYAWDL